MILPTASSGKDHRLTLLGLRSPPIPLSTWKARKEPGHHVKQNTPWHVCLFLHWQKPGLSRSRRLWSQIFTITLLKGTVGCDLEGSSPPLCLREIQNNARELEFLPGWFLPGGGMKEKEQQTADVLDII